MKAAPWLTAIAVLLGASACAPLTESSVINNKEISVEEGFAQIGRGIAHLREGVGSEPISLAFCAIDMNFKVGVSSKDDSHLVIKAEPEIKTPGADVGGKGSLDAGYQGLLTGNRENAIAIKLINYACAGPNTMIYEKPDKLREGITAAALMKVAGPNQNVPLNVRSTQSSGGQKPPGGSGTRGTPSRTSANPPPSNVPGTGPTAGACPANIGCR